MPRLPARALRYLRLCALLMLVVSLLARPMVEQLGGTHSVEHAALAATNADLDHDHDYAHDHGDDHDHPAQDNAADPEHTKGSHGLMHQAESAATAALSPTWSLLVVVPPTASPPRPDSIAPRLGIPATPFRPPIA